MAFPWPVMLWARLALPLLVWAYLAVLRRQRRMQERLADSHLLAYLVAPVSAWRRHLPGAIYLGAVLLLVLAMAPPTARQALDEPLTRLQPQQATSVGSAILEALRVLPLRKEFLGDRLERLRGPVPPQGPPGPAPAPTPGPRPP